MSALELCFLYFVEMVDRLSVLVVAGLVRDLGETSDELT